MDFVFGRLKDLDGNGYCGLCKTVVYLAAVPDFIDGKGSLDVYIPRVSSTQLECGNYVC